MNTHLGFFFWLAARLVKLVLFQVVSQEILVGTEVPEDWGGGGGGGGGGGELCTVTTRMTPALR